MTTNNQASNATNNTILVRSPSLGVHADGSTSHKAYVINYDDLYNLSRLATTRYYIDAMRRIEDEINKKRNIANQKGLIFEDDFVDKQLLYACYEVYLNVRKEINLAQNTIGGKCRAKYPMLAFCVPNSTDYARVVKKTVNQIDLTTVDLKDILPDGIISLVHYTSSTTSVVSLPEAVIKEIVGECDRILALDLIDKKIFRFLESRMESDASILARDIVEKLKETAPILPALEISKQEMSLSMVLS